MNGRDPYGTTARRNLLWPLALLLIAFVLGIGAAVLALRHWTNLDGLVRPSPPVIAAARPSAILPPAATAVPSLPPVDDKLAQRLATVEDRVGRIDARVAAATGDADRAEGLLVTFAARRALDRGQPLGFLEGMLRERFGGHDAASVAQVIAAAQRPVTLPQLQDGLAALKQTLIVRGADEGVWQGIRHELAGLFVVRRADEPSTIPADRFARAEHALEQGQADAAAAEVARMPGAARAAAWMAQARRYVMARNALDRLETAALLTPDPATPPPAASIPPTLPAETR